MRSALPKLPDIAEARIDAHPRLEGLLDAAVAQARSIHAGDAHVPGHPQARLRVAELPFVSGSPKKISIASPMNLSIVATVLECDCRHLGKILVEQERQPAPAAAAPW